MSGAGHGILSAEAAAGLEREPLAITARAVAKSLHQGSHRTAGVGGSTEFYDYKQYTEGDDTRFIDWKALGRTDKLYLKRFEHESQLTVSLVLDASASMRFADGDGEPSKLERACEIAASIAYIAVSQGDRLGLLVADGSRPEALEAGAGWAVFARVVRALRACLDLEPAGGGRGRFGGAVSGANIEGDLAVLVTDALDETGPLEKALHSVVGGRGRDLALVQVLTQTELDPSGLGSARFTDPESGEGVAADAAALAEAYRDRLAAHLLATERLVRSVRGVYHLATTADDPVDAVRAVARRGAGAR